MKVSLAYTEDSRWRNRSEVFQGREAIVAFLTRKWEKEHDYRLIKDLWAFDGNRIAVRFQYEWHADRDPEGQAGDRTMSVAPKREDYDVVVIGAGPAGLAAAATSAEAGLSTLLLDENIGPGGQVFRAIASTPVTDRNQLGADYWVGADLVQSLRASDAEVIHRATVWSLDRNLDIAVSIGGASAFVKAKRVILATGALERPFPIPGWTLPGVMTAGAAQTMAATKVYSTLLFAFAATGSILLGFSPKFGALILSIPGPVIGGLSIVLFGLIAAMAGRIWVENKVDFANPANLITVAVALTAGAGDLTLKFGAFTIGGIGTATFGAIILYQILTSPLARRAE